eukprot:15245-Heterococcus_DN1.PRE.1
MSVALLRCARLENIIMSTTSHFSSASALTSSSALLRSNDIINLKRSNQKLYCTCSVLEIALQQLCITLRLSLTVHYIHSQCTAQYLEGSAIYEKLVDEAAALKRSAVDTSVDPTERVEDPTEADAVWEGDLEDERDITITAHAKLISTAEELAASLKDKQHAFEVAVKQLKGAVKSCKSKQRAPAESGIAVNQWLCSVCTMKRSSITKLSDSVWHVTELHRQLLQQAEKLNGRTSFKAYAKLQQALLHMTKAEFKDNSVARLLLYLLFVLLHISPRYTIYHTYSITNTLATLAYAHVTALYEYHRHLLNLYTMYIPEMKRVRSFDEDEAIYKDYWATHRKSQLLGYLYSSGRAMTLDEQLGYAESVIRMNAEVVTMHTALHCDTAVSLLLDDGDIILLANNDSNEDVAKVIIEVDIWRGDLSRNKAYAQVRAIHYLYIQYGRAWQCKCTVHVLLCMRASVDAASRCCVLHAIISAHVSENDKIVNSMHTLNWLQRQCSKASKFYDSKFNKNASKSSSWRLGVGKGSIKVEHQSGQRVHTASHSHYYDQQLHWHGNWARDLIRDLVLVSKGASAHALIGVNTGSVGVQLKGVIDLVVLASLNDG